MKPPKGYKIYKFERDGWPTVYRYGFTKGDMLNVSDHDSIEDAVKAAWRNHDYAAKQSKSNWKEVEINE